MLCFLPLGSASTGYHSRASINGTLPGFAESAALEAHGPQLICIIIYMDTHTQPRIIPTMMATGRTSECGREDLNRQRTDHARPIASGACAANDRAGGHTRGVS